MILGKEYKIRSFLREILWFLFCAFIFIYLILIVIASGGSSDPASLEPAIIIGSALLPFFLFIVYFLYQNYGKTILTDSEIITKKFGFEKHMCYSDIKSVKEKDFNFPGNIVLKSEEKKIKISYNSYNFSEIYYLLIKKVSVLQNSINIDFQWALKIKFFKLRRWLNSISLFLIWGVPLGIVYFLSEFSNERTKIFTALAFITFWILISLLCVYLYFMEDRKKNQPYAFTFYKDHIDFQLPQRLSESVTIHKVKKIELMNTIRSGSVPGEGISVSFQFQSIAMIISDNRKLIIDNLRARQFGYSVLKIFNTLMKLYPGLI